MMGEDYLSSESFFGFLFKQVIEALRHICPASIQIIFQVLNEKKRKQVSCYSEVTFIYIYLCMYSTGVFWLAI